MHGWEIEGEVQEAIQDAFGLGALRAGSHVLHDSQRGKLVKVQAHRLWIVQIQPTFLSKATLAILTTDRDEQAVFLLQRDMAWVRVGPIVIDSAISEPVVTALHAFDLVENTEAIPIAGASYQFFVTTSAASYSFAFSNPSTPSLLRLVRALRHTLEGVTTQYNEPHFADYLADWRNY